MDERERRTAARLRERLGSWWIVGVFGAIYVVSQLTLAVLLHPIGPRQVFELQTTLSPQVFAKTLQRWERAGLLGTYASHYYLDFLHPVWYSIFLAALLARTFDAVGVSDRWNAVLFVPFLAGSLDVVENLVHVYYLVGGARPTAGPVVLGGLAAITKWGLAAGVLVSVLVLGVRGVGRTSSSDRPSQSAGRG